METTKTQKPPCMCGAVIPYGEGTAVIHRKIWRVVCLKCFEETSAAKPFTDERLTGWSDAALYDKDKVRRDIAQAKLEYLGGLLDS